MNVVKILLTLLLSIANATDTKATISRCVGIKFLYIKGREYSALKRKCRKLCMQDITNSRQFNDSTIKPVCKRFWDPQQGHLNSFQSWFQSKSDYRGLYWHTKVESGWLQTWINQKKCPRNKCPAPKRS